MNILSFALGCIAFTGIIVMTIKIMTTLGNTDYHDMRSSHVTVISDDDSIMNGPGGNIRN